MTMGSLYLFSPEGTDAFSPPRQWREIVDIRGFKSRQGRLHTSRHRFLEVPYDFRKLRSTGVIAFPGMETEEPRSGSIGTLSES